jgi:MFS transporter, UMF1 family
VNKGSRTYDRRKVSAWALYDFANSSFTTLVVTFIYSAYFASALVEDDIQGTALWSRGITVTALLVALLSPYVGAIADRGGYRRRFLFITTAITIVATVLLYFVEPGQVWLALGVFVVGNIAYELGYVFYNAYLPDIAPPEKIGRISGYGWGLGYLGGLLCLAIALVALVMPEEPLFGFSTANGENIRATNLLVAGWFALFSVPAFLVLKDQKPEIPIAFGTLLRTSTHELLNTLSSIRRYRQVVRLLMAHLIYHDGLVTIFAFGGIYASIVFGFDFQDLLIFGIVINVTAGLGAVAFGFFDDRLGGKATVLVSLVGLFAFTCLALATRSVTWFWVAAAGIGLLSGPNQSASRSMMGRFVPPDKESEFFGFFALSGKATTFLGPLVLGLLTEAFDSIRVGLGVIAAFFVIGGLLLLRVNEAEGYRLAAPPGDAPTSLPIQ